VAAGTDNPLSLTVMADRRIVARFVRSYAITINPRGGGGGTVSATPMKATYDAGESIGLTAIPDAGYRFTGWTIDSQLVSVEQSYTLVVTSDHQIVAGFAPLTAPIVTPTAGGSPGGSPTPTVRPTYALVLSAGAGGGVSALPSPGPYAPGTRVQVSAAPESGFVFTG